MMMKKKKKVKVMLPVMALVIVDFACLLVRKIGLHIMIPERLDLYYLKCVCCTGCNC